MASARLTPAAPDEPTVYGARRSHGVSNVPSRKQRYGSQADGTARAIRVGRPRLVGETTPSRTSQRSAHTPASCLRGIGIAEPPTEESSRFSAGRMSISSRASGSTRVSHLCCSMVGVPSSPIRTTVSAQAMSLSRALCSCFEIGSSTPSAVPS